MNEIKRRNKKKSIQERNLHLELEHFKHIAKDKNEIDKKQKRRRGEVKKGEHRKKDRPKRKKNMNRLRVERERKEREKKERGGGEEIQNVVRNRG